MNIHFNTYFRDTSGVIVRIILNFIFKNFSDLE